MAVSNLTGLHSQFKHGHAATGKRSPEYVAWQAMIARCTFPKHPGYKNYGGRGITVCERWLKSFELFLSDVGIKPTSKHTLDRFPNSEGNYEFGNVRWATWSEQSRNRRNNRLLTWNGETRCVSDWAVIMNIKIPTLWGRLIKGWTVEAALNNPVRFKRCKG